MATNFLLNEDDGQYYAGQQYLNGQAAGSGSAKALPATTFNTDLVSAYNSSAAQVGSASNFEVYFRTGTNAYKKLNHWLYLNFSCFYGSMVLV